MKTVQLVSQALAYRIAKQAGAGTAFLVEDDFVTEAASANIWIVDAGGNLITRNLTEAILPGITRSGVLQLVKENGLTVEERAFTPEETLAAREVFTTSSGRLVLPVVTLEGESIANGQPGPITRKIQRLYYETIGADIPKVAPWTLD